MRGSRTVVGVAMLVALAGCDADVPPPEPRSERVPTTPRSLAAVAAEYAGEPLRGSGSDDLRGLGGKAVAAFLQYAEDRQVAVAVVERLPEDEPEYTVDCATVDTRLYECAQLEDGTLVWKLTQPESDPGYVSLTVAVRGGFVSVFQSSVEITRDPRELDLDLSVDDMTTLAGDARVGFTTTEAAVAAGDALGWFDVDTTSG